MANFGLCHLTVVAPWAPTWRQARSAIGAPDVLTNARETATLAEAVAASSLVIGTGCLTYRKPELPVLPLPLLAPRIAQELDRGCRISLVFGSEKHGLTREDLSWCHLLTVIPTHPCQPSMNLGQAAAVCLYELAARQYPADDDHRIESIELDKSSATVDSNPLMAPAVSGHLDILAGLIEEAMLASGYSPLSMQPANRYDLRLLLRRLAPNAGDTRRMLGLFRRILWRLKRRPSQI
jgi:tRNA/rRNA methyltransferase